MSTSPAPSSVPTYRLYRERSGESGDFWLHCETIPERTHLHNWEIAVHRHDAFFQIFMLTAGGGELLGTAAPRRFHAPAALFVPPGAAHGFRFSRAIDGLVVTALADRLRSIAATDRAIDEFVGEPRIVPLPGAASPLRRSIERIYEEAGHRQAGRGVLLEALMTDAIVSLVRAGAQGHAALAGAIRRDAKRFAELETLIAAHFREQRPVGFYAERLGVSPAHLNRITRRACGMSVSEMAAARVAEAARRELVFTPSPVQSIAFGLGFQDPAYFNRFFRKRTGMTPGAFREAERRRLTG